MKLSSLQGFTAAIEAGSLRAAAERLGVSQPALTKLIRELEQEVSAKVLTRTSRGVAPTAHGLLLYEHATKIQREVGLAQARIRALSGKAHGEISVSAVPLAIAMLVPQAIRTFAGEFPHVKLRVHEELYPAQLSSLRKGEVDITVGGIPSGIPRGEISVTPLLKTSMAIVTRKASPWSKATSLRQLHDAPWIYTDTKRATGYAAELFASQGMSAPPCGVVVNSTLTMLSILERVDYVALLPVQLARHPWAQMYLSQIAVVEGMLELNIGAMVGGADVRPIVRSFLVHLERAASGGAENP